MSVSFHGYTIKFEKQHDKKVVYSFVQLAPEVKTLTFMIININPQLNNDFGSTKLGYKVIC